MTDFNKQAANAIAQCAQTHHIEHASEPALHLAMVDFLQQVYGNKENVIQFWWCDQMVDVHIDDHIYSTLFYFEDNAHLKLARALVTRDPCALAQIRETIMDIAVRAIDAAMNDAKLSLIAIHANFSGLDQTEEQFLQHAGCSHA